jgi:hypothetical protein
LAWFLWLKPAIDDVLEGILSAPCPVLYEDLNNRKV